MGKTDRSPRMGKKVERDPGVCRTLLTEIKEKFRLPKFSAKHAAVAASAITVSAAIVIVSVFGGKNTPVQAADFYVGTETETVAPSVGIGRYSDIRDEVQSQDVTGTDTAPEAIPEPDDNAASDNTDDSSRFLVKFDFYGRDSISCSATDPATVGEFAERLGIIFDESDVLNVSLDTVISDDTTITSDSVTYDTVSVSTAIKFETKYVDNASMYAGSSNVKQKGVNGESITEYEVKYVNGVEVSRTEIRTYVNKKPVDKIVERGTKTYSPSPSVVVQSGGTNGGTFVGGDGKTYRYSSYIDVKAVWYPTGGYTYIGLPADENVIAVDPTVIPLGSQVYITGDYADIGVRTAADIGSSVKGNIIDICFDRSNPLAANFGARPMRVYILA